MLAYAFSLLLAILCALLLLRLFVIGSARVLSVSMMPTLQVGDFVIINKIAYGLRWPMPKKKLIGRGAPKRGDVIAFRHPRDESTRFIKRVIGLPGDRVYYRGKTIYVNGEPFKKKPIGRYVHENGQLTALVEGAEQIGAEHEHRVLINPRTGDFTRACDLLARGPVTVPEGEYFVMGDYRDNSNDSRCFGFVPEENLIGKASRIWMRGDGTTVNVGL